MPLGQKLRILCYDVSCDRRRRRIAKILEDVASRVQFSVFEGRLSKRALAVVVADATKHLDKDDSLRVYTVGQTGERHCVVHGSGVPIDCESGYWLL